VVYLLAFQEEFQFFPCGIRHTAGPSVKSDDADFNFGFHQRLFPAHNRLIQTHVGWHRRGIDIPKFYAALAQALMATRAQAQSDCISEDVLTLT